MKIIGAKYLFLKDKIIEDGYLGIDGGMITHIFNEKPQQFEDHQVTYYEDAIIAPGFVETHIHGYAGFDVMDGTLDALQAISNGIVANGVTAFLPTTLTASREDLTHVAALIGEHAEDVEGAKIAGIFFEGPFFTEEHKGAQNPAFFGDPSIELLELWQKKSKHLIKKIAIAPERDGVDAFITRAKELGITVALAHSNASYIEATFAIEAGASIFIHTFNGMKGFTHRDPGMVGAAMQHKTTFKELICDGHHVHPVAANILMDVAGRENIVLVTDCMRAGGMPDGEYQLGDFPVKVADGTARLVDGDSLAGSVLKLQDAIKNVTNWGIATKFEAIQMATHIPAKSVGIDDRYGEIAVGRYADFVILDQQLDVLKTFIDGKNIYTNLDERKEWNND